MARRNQKNADLRLPEHMETVRSVRLPNDLAKAVDKYRGEVPFSDFCREALYFRITDQNKQAIDDCMEYIRRRGLSVETLMEYLTKGGK